MKAIVLAAAAVLVMVAGVLREHGASTPSSPLPASVQLGRAPDSTDPTTTVAAAPGSTSPAADAAPDRSDGGQDAGASATGADAPSEPPPSEVVAPEVDAVGQASTPPQQGGHGGDGGDRGRSGKGGDDGD